MKKDLRKIILMYGGAIALGLLSILGINIMVTQGEGEITVKIKYANDSMDGDMGELEEVPIIEEIDGGGKFEDKNTGVSKAEEMYYELGAIEKVDTSSPEAFKDSVLGRCLYANNYWGAQCVSLARDFWYSYAGFDVSTCGTGLAKGMMNCAEENARDRFKIIWNTSEIQEGTWIVTDGSWTGHICMAMGPVENGYVTCLGENQGGGACEGGGAAANLVKLNVKNFIGGYTPLDYIHTEPEPTPNVPDTGINK